MGSERRRCSHHGAHSATTLEATPDRQPTVLSIPGFLERRSSKTSHPSREAHMLNRLLESSPHGIWKWLAYALVLLAPGSFIILAVVGLIRHLRAHDGGCLFLWPIHACNSASSATSRSMPAPHPLPMPSIAAAKQAISASLAS
jgi:hypothetical protein